MVTRATRAKIRSFKLKNFKLKVASPLWLLVGYSLVTRWLLVGYSLQSNISKH